MALDRYQFTNISNDKTKNFRIKKSTLYPKIGIESNDILIYSKEGDTLWSLAYKYYDDITMWWIIAQANHIGKNSQVIRPGIQIRIPQNIDIILSDLQRINTTR